jgi:ABC-type uncharacterized transport system YnjBCD permease subunit
MQSSMCELIIQSLAIYPKLQAVLHLTSGRLALRHQASAATILYMHGACTVHVLNVAVHVRSPCADSNMGTM